MRTSEIKLIFKPSIDYIQKYWAEVERTHEQNEYSKNPVTNFMLSGKRTEEDESRRKLHNDELHSLYSSPNIVRVTKSRRVRWTGHVARTGEGRGVYRVLVGSLEGKRRLGRPMHSWEDNIKMDLREIGIDGAN